MGRSSGFIAMQSSLASGQIDICLIPEVCKIKIEHIALFLCRIDKLIQVHLWFKGSFQSAWTSWSFESSQVPYRIKGISCSLCSRGSWTGDLDFVIITAIIKNCIPDIFIFLEEYNAGHRNTNFLTNIIFLMQNLLKKTNATDASGNVIFGDIGVYIQQEVCYYLLILLTVT